MSEWHEITIHGAERAARAFVVGFAAGAGRGQEGFLGGDLDLDHESLGGRLKELLTAGSHQVLLAPRETAAPLVEALRARGGEVGLAVERCRVVESARFTFRIQVYARDVAQQLRAALLETSPPGVSVEVLDEAEESHPEVHGVELYAPLHAFSYRASGRVVGPLSGVLEMRRRALEWEQVEIGKLHLQARPLS